MTSPAGNPQSIDADPTQVIAHLASQVGELTRQVAVLTAAYQTKAQQVEQLRTAPTARPSDGRVTSSDGHPATVVATGQAGDDATG